MKSLLFWSASALLVFGEVMILRAWWSGRTPAAGMRRPRASEFAWIAIPVLVLGATLALTWRAQRTEPQPNEPAHVHPEAS